MREAAWEAARTAVEQTGGDLRVCEKQISSCETEQQKAVDKMCIRDSYSTGRFLFV